MTSFATDVGPLFREKDVASMRFLFDLHAYDDVRSHADGILETVEDGSMPCDSPWSEEQVAVFRAWMEEGFPE
jgi:hypothetical protein